MMFMIQEVILNASDSEDYQLVNVYLPDLQSQQQQTADRTADAVGRGPSGDAKIETVPIVSRTQNLDLQYLSKIGIKHSLKRI